MSNSAHLVRDYVLGTLSSVECSIIEQQYFADDDFFANVQAAELELIRDYLVGDLDSEESRLFEMKYLGSSGPVAEEIQSTQMLLAAIDNNTGVSGSGFRDNLLQAKRDDEVFVTGAVTEVLLPSLPSTLRLPPIECPKRLFLAIDSVAMAVHRRFRGVSTPGRAFVFAIDNSIRVGTQVAIPSNILIGEIAAVAKVPIGTAGELLTWIREAACSHPRLMIGLTSSAIGGSACALVLTKRVTSESLRSRWDLASGQSSENLDLFDGRLDGVAV